MLQAIGMSYKSYNAVNKERAVELKIGGCSILVAASDNEQMNK